MRALCKTSKGIRCYFGGGGGESERKGRESKIGKAFRAMEHRNVTFLRAPRVPIIGNRSCGVVSPNREHHAEGEVLRTNSIFRFCIHSLMLFPRATQVSHPPIPNETKSPLRKPSINHISSQKPSLSQIQCMCMEVTAKNRRSTEGKDVRNKVK